MDSSNKTQYISKIEGMYISDVNAVLEIVPDDSTYIVRKGSKDTIYDVSVTLPMPASVNKTNNAMGDVSAYDESAEYHMHDYVRHDKSADNTNILYRCIVEDTSGKWDETHWEEATILSEMKETRITDSMQDASINYAIGKIDYMTPDASGTINQVLTLGPDNKPIWQDQGGVETVILQLSVETGTGSVAGIQISVDVEGENIPRQLVSDENGKCTFRVNYGLQYVITFGTIEGYLPIANLTYRAALLSRQVYGVYRENAEVHQEHVTVWLYYTSGSTNRADYVKVTVGSVTTSYPTVAGTTYDTCEFYVDHESTYTIVFNDVDTYATPHSQTYVSQFRARSVKTYYIGAVADVAWVKKSDGSTIPFNDITMDNVHEYFGLRLSSSTLATQNAAFIIPLEYLIASNIAYPGGTITARSIGNRAWASSNVLFDDRPCYDTRAKAITNDGNANFDGQNNTDVFIAEAARKTAAGQSLSVPAMIACKDIQYTVNDVDIFGFLGSLLQMETFAGKYNDIDNLLAATFSVHCITIRSGNWWTSTQVSPAFAWKLYNGSAYSGNIKASGYSVVPFFAI